ncbi:zinc-binding dehydrogenase [Halalkalibacter sp. APA_J-10(15)]|uniref:zinc-dependent alcohol dehydrogenase n=1 Tax=unclassified Halalkalibacter TaxID=2893063 RepID=UPI001FF28F3F|nr:alcohol dehydrogenase catalytic domain-containing protein [Halalkalibacter sp. APA_J-10(15)]MCK0472203.1 alcohol dehydrogenase catalytic domain-containing protein [Halalkalibacter sp. APA_J-10(15)]
MKALQFDLNIPKYVFSKAIGKMNSALFIDSPFSCLQLKDLERPKLPNNDWVEVKIKYGGICGSDLNLIYLNDSPSTSPFVSFPFTMGHELVGTISKVGTNVENISNGQRVVIDPVLSCEARNIAPSCEECSKGNYNLCEHMNNGIISPGLLTGTCKDTGGSWGGYLVAHKSQIIALPDTINDENGILIEPFSCALHAVLRNKPKVTDTVIVIGAGVIGLCVIAAIRALKINCKIITLVKHPFQAELANHFGSNEVVFLSRQHDYIYKAAKSCDATVLKPIIGSPIVNGGADIIYECAGNPKSLQDSFRFARKGGKVVLIGLASFIEKLDMTMIWLNELEIKGSFAYSSDSFQGKQRKTLEIAVELLKTNELDLSPLLTHKFPLENYREALFTAGNKHKEKAVKVVFEPS